MNKLLLLFSLTLSIPVLPLRRFLETARVSPIPKTDYPQSEKDYRPVSILSTLSKVFERLVLKQLISYNDELSLLAPSISDLVSARAILL